jgi:hypothetical protein
MPKYKASKLKVRSSGRNGKVKIILPEQPVQVTLPDMPLTKAEINKIRLQENANRLVWNK